MNPCKQFECPYGGWSPDEVIVGDYIYAGGLESPVTWHCRACEAAVSPEGKVEHTEYCVVGKAEQHIAADVSYGPPAGDAGQEEFFSG